jgi:hypothetical protein
VEGNLDVLALEGLYALGEGEQLVGVLGEFGPLCRLIRVKVGVDENARQGFGHVEVSLQNAEIRKVLIFNEYQLQIKQQLFCKTLSAKKKDSHTSIYEQMYTFIYVNSI